MSMINKKMYLSLFLLIGMIQLSAQFEYFPDLIKEETKSCVSFAQVKQECQKDNTVDLTFLISNNSKCKATAVSVTPLGGFGLSYPISIGPQSVSNYPITHTGATPGTTLCFDVVLHGGDRRQCCRETVCIEIEECCTIPSDCCDLEALHVDTGGCDPENRWARVEVSGGTPPYTGPANSFPVTFGNFIVQGLSVGFHTLIFSDSEGCEAEITIYVPAGDCSNLDISLTQDSPPLAPITSHVSATVGITIVGWCIPDRVEVYVNGNSVVDLIAGDGGCDGPTNMGASDTFCVEPCDVVEIVTTGDICPNQHSCDGTSTAFDVYTWNCTLKGGGGDGNGGSRFANEIDMRKSANKELALNRKEKGLNIQEPFTISPNPVLSNLNIVNINTLLSFQTIRIINSAGQTIYSGNLSNLEQVQIDVSSYTNGIYMLEMRDNKGNKTAKRFVKLN